MKYAFLGNTGIEISKVCFGTLSISPLQGNFSLSEGEKVVCYAIDKGINFFDTAQLYETYNFLNRAIKYKKDIVISTKSYAYDKKTAKESFEKATKELGRDYIDIFMLHEQESKYTLKGHLEALEFFHEKKQQGYIGAVGVSTHFIKCVLAAVQSEYAKYIDVIHMLYNLKGLGIVDGAKDEMLSSTQKAFDSGKGIFAMKPLGGGHLIQNKREALDFVLNSKQIHGFAIGLKSKAQIDYICSLVENEDDEKIKVLHEQTNAENRKLMIHSWCIGCGNCVKMCKSGALSIVNNKAVVDKEKCILCSYCASACKDFCIKII